MGHGNVKNVTALDQPKAGGAAQNASRLDGQAEEDYPIPLAGSPFATGGTNAQNLYHTTLSEVLGESDAAGARYTKQRAIGRGAFGEAHVSQRNVSYDAARHAGLETQIVNNPFAAPTIPGTAYVSKLMDLDSMMQEDREYAKTEILCLAHSRHFAIIRYYEHFLVDGDHDNMVMVTELADHGDLNRNLKGSLQLTEREAGTFFVQLLLALHYIHTHRMIHRDVKSANLFVTSKGFLKIGDFGFSQQYESTVSSETVAGTFLGTPYYVSPEMWKGMRYGKKADVWAAGVVLYEMLMDGARPFDAENLPDLRAQVINAKVVLPDTPPPSKDPSVVRGPFSSEMRELVSSIFVEDPHQRPGTEALLHTPIMQHHLALFERHVQQLIASDAAARASGDAQKMAQLAFPDPADADLVLAGIAEGQNIIQVERQKAMVDAPVNQVRCEGVVYKDNRNGVWKERYLTLDHHVLIISLGAGKAAAGGGERSKKVPVSMLKGVSPCEPEDAHVRAVSQANGSSGGYKPPFAFAIAMESSNSIVFGVASESDLDIWMNSLMRAMQMD